MPSWLALILGCVYTAPLSDRFADNAPANVISGSVVTTSTGAAPNAVIFVSEAASPMPPDGAGTPQTIGTVSAQDFTVVDAVSQLKAAPFTVTNIPDGEWSVTGMLDEDADFSAVDSILSSWSCGDRLGGYRVDDHLGAVPVSGGEHRSGVTVTIDERITFERPSFTIEKSSIDGTPSNDVDISIAYELTDYILPQAFRIDATPIHAIHNTGGLTLNLDYTGDAGQNCEAGFEVILVDADGDGQIDPSTLSDQLVEAWPQLVLTYMGVPREDGTFDRSGIEEGVSWAGLALLHPLALPSHPEGLLNAPFYSDSLDIVWAPGAQKVYSDGSSEIIFEVEQIPKGAWDVTVLNPSGSFWYTPNTLSTDSWTPLNDQPWDPRRQAEYLMVTE